MSRLFAIIDRASGFFLPHEKAGASHAEFTDKLPPRLFLGRGPALTALRMWRDGHWRTYKEWESTNEYGEGYYIQGLPRPSDSKFNIERQRKRAAMDLVIVEVQLHFAL